MIEDTVEKDEGRKGFRGCLDGLVEEATEFVPVGELNNG